MDSDADEVNSLDEFMLISVVEHTMSPIVTDKYCSESFAITQITPWILLPYVLYENVFSTY